MNYWLIKLWGGDEIRVTPTDTNLRTIRKKLVDGEGFIVTKTLDINVRDVQHFYESDIPVPQETNLITLGTLDEDAARAFGEPLVNENENVYVRAVKKRVTRVKWERYYSANPSYKLIRDEEGHVIIGFLVPVHLINGGTVQYCDEAEARIVTGRTRSVT